MTATDTLTHWNVFTVKEFETKDGEVARKWTLVGVAFPHSDGPGFNVELQCVPLDGKLVALPPNAEARDAEHPHKAGNGSLSASAPPTSDTARANPEHTPALKSRSPSRDRRR